MVKLEKGDGYYSQNKTKFRDFALFKGKKRKLENKIIEKRNRRLDTLGETRGATVAQSLARSRCPL